LHLAGYRFAERLQDLTPAQSLFVIEVLPMITGAMSEDEVRAFFGDTAQMPVTSPGQSGAGTLRQKMLNRRKARGGASV
jgi:hypothetical protein